MVHRFWNFLLRDIYLKILALAIAILIYINAVLERTHSMSLKIPITFTNLAEGQVISEKSVDKAILLIEGKGKDFIGLYPKRLAFKINLEKTKLGNQKIKLFPEELGLPSTVSLKTIDPENVELTIDRLSKKSVEVSIPLKGKLEKGYTLVNIVPKTDVYLTGPRSDLNFISVVNTESLDIEEIMESKDIKLKVILPEGDNFSLESDSIEVSIRVEKESARIFLAVPLQIVGIKSRTVTVEPREAQIAVAGAESKLETMKPESIIARINITDLLAGTHQVRAEITLPPGISLVKCEPAFFRVKIQ